LKSSLLLHPPGAGGEYCPMPCGRKKIKGSDYERKGKNRKDKGKN
jgi:hypothetical protein